VTPQPTTTSEPRGLARRSPRNRPPVNANGHRSGNPSGRIGDRVFSGAARACAGFAVVLILLVAAFLIVRAVPVIRADQANFLFSRAFEVTTAPLRFGVLDLAWVTASSSLIALVLAVPVATGVALFITQYAPAAVRKPVGYVIDLLAAIPSIIYGIWGIYVLAPRLEAVQQALYHLGFIPLFRDEGVATGSIFDAAVVLAVMILPIVTAIARDVFDRTPREHVEAAWAIGATRWEAIRYAVLPYGRAGLVSGAMLGLGRALGETIAVMLILSKPALGSPFTWSMFAGGQTFASIIGLNMQEANGPTQTGAYIAAGLVLFGLSFLVNAAARLIVSGHREYA